MDASKNARLRGDLNLTPNDPFYTCKFSISNPKESPAFQKLQSSAVPASSILFWRSQSYSFNNFCKFVVCLSGKKQQIYDRQSILSGSISRMPSFQKHPSSFSLSIFESSTFVAETAGRCGCAISRAKVKVHLASELSCSTANLPRTHCNLKDLTMLSLH